MSNKIIKEYDGDKLVKEYDGDKFIINNISSSEQPNQNIEHKTKVLEWMRNYWRPGIAVLYSMILFLDFIIRPIVNITYAKKFNLADVINSVKQLDPAIQVKAIEIASRNELWPQITTPNVHYVFLVLLGITAWTRGQEKISQTKL